MSAQSGVSYLHTCTLRVREGVREREGEPFLLATQRFFSKTNMLPPNLYFF
jgi:hypothetical protein